VLLLTLSLYDNVFLSLVSCAKCYTTGLRIRSAVVMAVYRKAMVLSASERQTRTLGEITNLPSIDAQRLQGKPPADSSSPCIVALSGYSQYRLSH